MDSCKDHWCTVKLRGGSLTTRPSTCPLTPAGVLQWERHQRYIWAACLLLYLLLVLVAVILSCTATTHTSLTTSLDTACTTFIL